MNFNVNNQVNNQVNKNNVINFNICGKNVEPQTVKVDQQVVTDLFNAFMAIPSEVIVKFKNENGFLKIIVKMNHREKFFRTHETYADAKLVECIMGAMIGTQIGALETYNSEEHPISVSEIDPRVDLFNQFINSPLRCRFEADFIAGNGDRYVDVTFNIAYRKQIKFCLKRTEEIDEIINKALNVA